MNRFHFRRLIVCAAIPALLLAGCAPVSPLPAPLDEKDQQMVDLMWNNMLTPVDRLDRQTLMDAILANWLSQLGVDRMYLVSEKYISTGKVVMEVNSDRANPSADQFTVTVFNDRGKTVRRERYSRSELDKSVDALTDKRIGPLTTQPATRTETPEDRQHRLEYERRAKAVQAATQPAR